MEFALLYSILFRWKKGPADGNAVMLVASRYDVTDEDDRKPGRFDP
jgi:hypothetical protein